MKKLMFGSRRVGKTSSMLDILRAQKKLLLPRGIQPYFIAFSEERANQLSMDNPDLRENIMGWESFARVRMGRAARDAPIYVDDAEMVLANALGLYRPIEAASMTLPEEVVELELEEENDEDE